MAENSLIKALEEIRDFGYANSGKGFSCAKMAEKALAECEAAVVKPTLCEVPSNTRCDICYEYINDLSANPSEWGVALPHENGNGKMKYYHRQCATIIIARHVG